MTAQVSLFPDILLSAVASFTKRLDAARGCIYTPRSGSKRQEHMRSSKQDSLEMLPMADNET